MLKFLLLLRAPKEKKDYKVNKMNKKRAEPEEEKNEVRIDSSKGMSILLFKLSLKILLVQF